jgi:hypothetical protein
MPAVKKVKDTTARALLVARTLFERAADLCAADDRHLASAGLVILQDALELAFYGLLIELDVDEHTNLESKSFDELVAELKKADVSVPKSGTLKALNKQRILTKHYAQLAEPATVRGYFDAASTSLSTVVASVTGKALSDIYMSDLLEAGETRSFLKLSESLVASGKFFDALVAIRKAIFLEFEVEYSVYAWRDYDDQEAPIGLGHLGRGGWKAPYWTRNKEWILKNVRDPLDYVQLDYDRWRIDAMEWGINTAELQNIRNLTPSVFRPENGAEWSIKYHTTLVATSAAPANAKYCLDRAIAVVLKKQEYGRVSRYPSRSDGLPILPSGYVGDKVHLSASLEAPVVHIISNDYEYNAFEVVSGLDQTQTFIRILGASRVTNEKGQPTKYTSGYVLAHDQS